MPQILRIDRGFVFFWINECSPLEPVSKGHPVPHAAKSWLLASGRCRLCSNGSMIPEPVLRNIMRVPKAYHEEIVEKWAAYFGNIRFMAESGRLLVCFMKAMDANGICAVKCYFVICPSTRLWVWCFLLRFCRSTLKTFSFSSSFVHFI